MVSTNKGPDGLCIDCGGTHDYWHAEEPEQWSYKEGCWCHLCQQEEEAMNKQKTVATLQLRYFEDHRQNIALRCLVREARAYIQSAQGLTPEVSVWVRDWMRHANELLEQETPQ